MKCSAFATIAATLAICLFVLLTAPQAWGMPQDERKKAMEEKLEKPAPAEEAEKKDEPAKEPKEKWLAVKGGDVYTITGPVLRDAIVLAKDGIIVDLGRDIAIPDGAEILDATGHRVYPGLVAVSSSGLLGSEPPEHSTDVYGLNMILGLSGGLTTVVTGNTAAKLTYGTLEKMVLKRGLFTTISYSRRSSAQRRALRADLDKVRGYLRDVEVFGLRKAAGDKDAKEPDNKWIKGKYSTYLKLLKGEVTAILSCDLTQDLRDAADLAEYYGFNQEIRGGGEAWAVAPELGRSNVSMIITPRRKIRQGPSYGPEDDEDINPDLQPILAAWEDKRLLRETGTSPELARILYDHGVTFAIIPQSGYISLGGITGRDIATMPMEAAFAVRGGLPEDAAIEAITINAARLLGVDHRVGSIEVGKDADLIILDGDLLHYKSMVQWAVVNGRIAYDKEKESLFAHIRPRGKEGTEAIPEFWPRDLGPMPTFVPDVEPPVPGEEPPAPGEEPPAPGEEPPVAGEEPPVAGEEKTDDGADEQSPATKEDEGGK